MGVGVARSVEAVVNVAVGAGVGATDVSAWEQAARTTSTTARTNATLYHFTGHLLAGWCGQSNLS